MTKLSDDHKEIELLVSKYCDGLYTCDTDILGDVFHQHALYATVSGGETLTLSMDKYFPIVESRTPPASSSDPRSEEIISIDIVGGNTALVKLTCSFFQKNYTDFLTLIKENGKWLIISKVFHYDVIV